MGNGASTNHSNRQKSSTADSLREPEENEDEFLCLQPGYPSPRPPRNKKEDVFAPDGFTECDERGHMAPIDVSYSWGTLIQYLVWGFRSPMDKLRTLFVWMGAQDITHRILPPIEGMEPDTPYNDIRKIQRGKMSYALFLLKLCR
ncbi:uncharacterized protein LOC133201500 [Saccostrea echinata]|uniref:uncharacterized protein LOC133201500 n=1 Tax=Saccostrea echinata TaxID=191078 RepID=UPI002A831A85|nr:uncharacterized protein LOC133201500 [Saccostrea echinata]